MNRSHEMSTLDKCLILYYNSFSPSSINILNSIASIESLNETEKYSLLKRIPLLIFYYKTQARLMNEQQKVNDVA